MYFELKELCLTAFQHVTDDVFLELCLPMFPEWFYDSLVNWVALSFVNGQRMIPNMVASDKELPVTSHVCHST